MSRDVAIANLASSKRTKHCMSTHVVQGVGGNRAKHAPPSVEVEMDGVGGNKAKHAPPVVEVVVGGNRAKLLPPSVEIGVGGNTAKHAPPNVEQGVGGNEPSMHHQGIGGNKTNGNTAKQQRAVK